MSPFSVYSVKVSKSRFSFIHNVDYVPPRPLSSELILAFFVSRLTRALIVRVGGEGEGWGKGKLMALKWP